MSCQFLHALTNNLPVLTLIVTIGLAFVGYIVTYCIARNLAQKKDSLELERFPSRCVRVERTFRSASRAVSGLL